jgi:hypothetical protein
MSLWRSPLAVHVGSHRWLSSLSSIQCGQARETALMDSQRHTRALLAGLPAVDRVAKSAGTVSLQDTNGRPFTVTGTSATCNDRAAPWVDRGPTAATTRSGARLCDTSPRTCAAAGVWQPLSAVAGTYRRQRERALNRSPTEDESRSAQAERFPLSSPHDQPAPVSCGPSASGVLQVGYLGQPRTAEADGQAGRHGAGGHGLSAG